MIARLRRHPRPTRRALVLLPNGFTLLNLFFGIFSIVLSSRGSFGSAVLFIVLGGVADSLDGRVARAVGTGTRFGEELDSLVDAISFGLAPAMIMYFAVLNKVGWDWIFVFIFTAFAVMRLARFNVEQAGRAKTHFHGLPSPAAGMTLATYYWFSQTPLYNETVIFFTSSTVLADWPWHVIVRVLMVVLALLMLSDVPYPAVPTIGFRSLRKVVGTVIVVGTLLGLFFARETFIFPALVAYVIFGAVKWYVLGFLERRPDHLIFLEEEPDQLEEEEEEEEEEDEIEYVLETPPALSRPTRRATPAIDSAAATLEGAPGRKKRRRRRRGSEPRGSESRGSESRGSESRGSESRGSESRRGEPRGGEPRGGESHRDDGGRDGARSLGDRSRGDRSERRDRSARPSAQRPERSGERPPAPPSETSSMPPASPPREEPSE